MKTAFIRTSCTDPHINLAREEYLLECVPAGCIWLYLWQNDRTVVIGHNQDAFAECRLEKLEQDGGHLVRRLSGGGAVYHDTGNLNFTFLSTGECDRARHMRVILRALKRLGIEGELTGRNDLTVRGGKCSGSAYYRSGERYYHHGTLLVNTDLSAMERYLTPDRKKTESKGVSSVKSRVMNLSEVYPGLSLPELETALTDAFGEEYGTIPEALPDGFFDAHRLDELSARYASDAWNLRPLARADWVSGTVRLPDGLYRLALSRGEGRVSEARIYTDALDVSAAREAEQRLRGVRWCRKALEAVLEASGFPGPAFLTEAFPEG